MWGCSYYNYQSKLGPKDSRSSQGCQSSRKPQTWNDNSVKKETMTVISRRLKNLNLVEEEGNEQHDEQVQGPPLDINVGFPEGAAPPRRSFKIIWPNGVVREIFRNFRTAELWGLNGGRVLVETDENGVPNQWSESILSSYLGELAQNSSFAPLHIPRWDSKLFKGPKERIIKDVEKKFSYSGETKWFTRDWILKTVNKRWRDYKSDLKKKYFNPDERSLDQIEKDVPDGVNENQWSFLLGLWSSEAHKKLCRTNAESGKKQMHPHTSGRKSHARLKREMEVEKKRSITKIDLWDESHKKKDGNYVNQNVQRLMDKASEELENRRSNKGALSTDDYDDVFENVIRKDLKVHGYYDDTYWSNGSNSHVHPEKNTMMRRHLQLIISEFKDMQAFLKKKYPEEPWISTRTVAAGNTSVNDRLDPENISGEYFNEERSSYEIPSSPNNEQTHAMNCNASNMDVFDPLDDNMVFKQSQVTSSSDVNQDRNNRSFLPNEEMTLKEPQRKRRKQNKSQEKKKMVLLFSTRKTRQGQVVAVGNLISRDSTHEIRGTMIGDGYYAVEIQFLNDVEGERLPQPYGGLKTIEDAVGMCVAWPSSHLKRVKPTNKKNT